MFGQAKSHCVRSTLNDIQSHLEPKVAGKIYILEDAMSPVTPPPLDPLPDALNFPKIADQAIEQWRAAGMNVVKTSDEVRL